MCRLAQQLELGWSSESAASAVNSGAEYTGSAQAAEPSVLLIHPQVGSKLDAAPGMHPDMKTTKGQCTSVASSHPQQLYANFLNHHCQKECDLMGHTSPVLEMEMVQLQRQIPFPSARSGANPRQIQGSLGRKGLGEWRQQGLTV